MPAGGTLCMATDIFQTMKKQIIIPLCLAALLSAACGRTEHTEAVTAEIEAAQMEGRNAAREFVNTRWKDTLELQRRLLEVRSRQSKYIEAKDTDAAVAFDTTFVNTLRTVRPDIARFVTDQAPAPENTADR